MCRAFSTALLFAAIVSFNFPVAAQTATRSPKAASKQPELLATLEHHLGWGGNFSRGPRVGVYADGSVIFAKRAADATEATYYRGLLNLDEFQQVDRALQAAYATMNKDIHLAPGWNDLPEITLAVRFLKQPKTISVTGFQLEGHFAPPKTDKKKRPDPLPPAIDRAAKMLMYLDPANAEKWQAELFEIRLTISLHEIPESVQTWPADWPNLKAKTTAETRYGRRGEPEYSILLTAAEHQRFLEFAKENSYFAINGKTLSAYHWRPVLPDSLRWRQYQAIQK